MAAGADGLAPPEARRACRADGDGQAQDRGFQAADTPSQPCRSDAACGDALPVGAAACGTRGGRARLSPDRHRSGRIGRGGPGRSARSAR